MPELALPPPSAAALLSEGTALGVWRSRRALLGLAGEPGPHAGQARAQWYEVRHALAADQRGVVLVLPRSERAMDMILRFGDLAADIEPLLHPALTLPTDSGVTPAGHPYLIFEGLVGQPLLRAAQGLPLRERLSLVLMLCEALISAHRQGWLWAEIDPAMVWLGRDRLLRVIALGLLRMPDPLSPREPLRPLRCAPGHASPELQAGEPPSLRSEVFGLGMILQTMVQDSAKALPIAAERFSLEALLQKAVAPRADSRYAHVEALAQDLRAWLAGASLLALPLQPMPEPQGVLMRPAAARQWTQQPPRAGRALAAAGVMLSVMLAAGLWLERDAGAGLGRHARPSLLPTAQAGPEPVRQAEPATPPSAQAQSGLPQEVQARRP